MGGCFPPQIGEARESTLSGGLNGSIRQEGFDRRRDFLDISPLLPFLPRIPKPRRLAARRRQVARVEKELSAARGAGGLASADGAAACDGSCAAAKEGLAPPSLPYKVDTSRPSLRTNWTRLVPFPQVLAELARAEAEAEELKKQAEFAQGKARQVPQAPRPPVTPSLRCCVVASLLS